MPSLNNAADRAALITRLEKLAPDMQPRWGRCLSREPDAFDVERSNAKALIGRLAGNATYASHPIFGTLTKSEWGALGYEHFDHHVRQFGV